MLLVIAPFTFFEAVIFLMAVVAFVLTVRFFVDSQKRLKKLLPADRRKKKSSRIGINRSGFLVPKPAKQKKQPSAAASSHHVTVPDDIKEELKALRDMVLQQQEELTKAIQQISQGHQTNDDKPDVFVSIPNPDKKNLEQLQLQLERKEAEIKKLKQQEALSQKLQERFEDVESEFERLQEKMLKMEHQAMQAAELSVQLEHAEQTQLQLEKTLLQKEEKLRELANENHRLQNLVSEVADKLSQANMHRQQLMKKVQFMEEVNADIMQMTEANRKLKNEINRVAELESMLNLMTEERDALQKDK